MKSKVPQGRGAGLLAFLSGTVPVELRGRFSSADGTGQVEVEEALVAGVSLPPALVAQIVSQSTRSAKRPAGLRHPVPVPAALHGPPRPPRAGAGARRFLPVGPRRCRRAVGRSSRGAWTSRRRSSSSRASARSGPRPSRRPACAPPRTSCSTCRCATRTGASFARVADLRPGMRVSVSGEIAVAGLRRARRMTIYEVRLDDGSGRLKAVFFNQPYLKETLPRGQEGGALRPRRARRHGLAPPRDALAAVRDRRGGRARRHPHRAASSPSTRSSARSPSSRCGASSRTSRSRCPPTSTDPLPADAARAALASSAAARRCGACTCPATPTGSTR